MKKHLSVLALYARNNFARLLALLAAMGILESALFVLRWYRWDPEYVLPPAAEDLLKGVPLIGGLAFLLMTLLLCYSGDEGHGVGYTLQRLRICEEATVLWRAAYNCLCFLLLWAVQAAVAIGLCQWYAAVIGPEYSSSQTVFLAFYRSEFLHNLLPLDNWSRYLRNAIIVLALGFCTAVRTYKVRRGSQYGWGMVIFLWSTTVAAFRFGITNYLMDIATSLVPLAALGIDADYFIKEWRGVRNEA